MFRPVNIPFRIRQSSLQTSRCLFRFQQHHVLGVPDPTSEFAERGTDFHELSKLYVDFLVASKQQSDWSYGLELIGGANWNLEAGVIFKNWMENRSIDPSIVFGTELKIRLGWDLKPVTNDSEVVFSADIDRLDVIEKHADVTDYKTNFLVFEPQTIQAIMYPWLIFKTMPWLDSVSFTLDFVRYNTSRSRTFQRSDLPRMDLFIEANVSRLIDAYERNVWPAAINSTCSYCKLECPLVEAGLSREGIGKIGSHEEAVEIAQELYAMGKAYKQMHGALKAYAANVGTIDAGNDIKIGFKKQERIEFNARTIFQLNETYGFDKLRTFHVANKEVKKIARDYPDYAEKARSTAKDKSSTAFKFWNEVGDPMEPEGDDDL